MSEFPGIKLFILDDQHRPIPCPTMAEWTQCEATGKTVVARTEANGFFVSTKFFGMHIGNDYKLDYETMAFNKAGEILQQMRCHEWDEAVRQHAAVCALVGIKP